jgi:hypothetical protein
MIYIILDCIYYIILYYILSSCLFEVYLTTLFSVTVNIQSPMKR